MLDQDEELDCLLHFLVPQACCSLEDLLVDTAERLVCLSERKPGRSEGRLAQYLGLRPKQLNHLSGSCRTPGHAL